MITREDILAMTPENFKHWWNDEGQTEFKNDFLKASTTNNWTTFYTFWADVWKKV